MQGVADLPDDAQDVAVVVLPQLGIQAVGGCELRHPERQVDVLEPAAEDVQRTPHLRVVLADGLPLPVQFSREQAGEFLLRIVFAPMTG